MQLHLVWPHLVRPNTVLGPAISLLGLFLAYSVGSMNRSACCSTLLLFLSRACALLLF